MKIALLDHGYLKFIEAWGTGEAGVSSDPGGDHITSYECGIIEAARQSTQGSFRGWETDEKLLKHLYNNNHSTPFEFAGMIIEVQAPIFVFREWHRHRTQSYNEMSARYVPLPDLYYIPTVERIMIPPGSNKQAQGITQALEENNARIFRNRLKKTYSEVEKEYQLALETGIPKEVARLVMPVGHYSRMRASANLRNWLAFLTLRMDPNAQWEIRQYAEAVGSCIADKFPQTWKLFNARE